MDISPIKWVVHSVAIAVTQALCVLSWLYYNAVVEYGTLWGHSLLPYGIDEVGYNGVLYFSTPFLFGLLAYSGWRKRSKVLLGYSVLCLGYSSLCVSVVVKLSNISVPMCKQPF